MLDPAYLTRPDTDKIALDYRLRCVRARLAVLDKLLGDGEQQTEGERALVGERNALRGIRHEIELIIGSKMPKRPKEPKDQQRNLSMLRSSIYQRSRDTYGFADQLAREGDFRNARIHRLNVIYFGEFVCREYSIPVELLAFCEPPKLSVEP